MFSCIPLWISPLNPRLRWPVPMLGAGRRRRVGRASSTPIEVPLHAGPAALAAQRETRQGSAAAAQPTCLRERALLRFHAPQERMCRARARRRSSCRPEIKRLRARLATRSAPASTPHTAPRATLERFPRNPILQPQACLDWESQAVFNAAALDLDGRIHLLYRAVGGDGQSVLGHAVTRNGVDIEERSPAPVYALDPASVPVGAACPYSSGAAGPGCEDPRLTLLDGRIWLSYTEFDGAHPPRMALSSIALEDFRAQRWHWRHPIHLSPAGQAHKNWVLFPKRIGGRIALLHGIAPQPKLALLDTLDIAAGDVVPGGYCNDGDPLAWDNAPRGAGPPPIATPAGWLLIYHAMDRRDPGRYKLGAMLLDGRDPRRVLGRLPYPLLEPDARCENEGHKAGVVYCCGALARGDTLWVYYCGADSVVCVASVALDRLLAELRPAARPRRTSDARIAA